MKKISLLSGILMFALLSVQSQKQEVPGIPLIGSEAPSFEAVSTIGKINFPDDFGNHWKILFAHPRDFTPVCSSEILELAHQQAEFTKLGTNLIIVSADVLDSHQTWKEALEQIDLNNRPRVKINFPLVADESLKIIKSYGMLDMNKTDGQSIRGVFFIDPQNKIKAFYFYPNQVGRNVEEIKRTLIALQTNYKDNRALLPVNWQPGDDIMLEYLSQEELDELNKPDSKYYQPFWFMSYMKAK